MRRLISILLAVVLNVGGVSAFAIAQNTELYTRNMCFDEIETNAKPTGVSSIKGNIKVIQPTEEKNKVVAFACNAGTAELGVNVLSNANDMVYQFDYMIKTGGADAAISLTDLKGKKIKSIAIDGMGVISTNDNRKTSALKESQWYNIALIYHYNTKKYDLYMDNKCVVSNIIFDNTGSFDKAVKLNIEISGEKTAEYYIDNIRSYNSKTLLSDEHFQKREFNDSVLEVLSETDGDGEKIFFNYDFNDVETGKFPSAITVDVKSPENICEVREFPDAENKSMFFSKESTGDPLADFHVSEFSSGKTVFEFSFYTLDNKCDKFVRLRSTEAQFNDLLKIGTSGVLSFFGNEICSINKRTWNDVVILIDFAEKQASLYLNGKCKAENMPFPNQNFNTLGLIRFQYPSTNSSGAMYLDNIRFYEGTEQREIKVESIQGSKKEYITSESDVVKSIDDCIALTALSEKAFANGEKTDIGKKPEMVDNDIYIPLRFVTEGLGGKIEWNNNEKSVAMEINNKKITAKIDDTNITANGNTEEITSPVKLINGTTMISAADWSEITEIPYVYDKYLKLAVIGEKSTNLTDTQITDIYDYIVYTRPSKEQILKDFEPMEGVHPRIMATADTFDTIKNNIQSNKIMEDWYKELLEDADEILTQMHTYYTKPDGLRLLNMSRQLLNRAQTLGMAYKLSGETKYAEYLWDDLNAVCNFDDWNSANHYLDTAEMTTGVAIGYDWLYDYWTPAQRKTMENAILKLGLEPGNRCYQGDPFLNSGWVDWDSNWNQVCNGGMSIGCLALMDIYPEMCSEMIETALKSEEKMLRMFAPDGAWNEGPAYWLYIMQYLTYQMAAFDTALGTDYGYFSTNGIDKGSYFIEYMQSSQGSFNIQDADRWPVNAPYIFYAASKNGDGDLARWRLTDMKQYNFKSSASDLLFIDVDNISENVENLSKDRMFENVEIASFRSEFNNNQALYAAISAGDNTASHSQLDCGTFVFDALGERWACELGPEDYNVEGYFGSERLKYYRCSAQGQNIIALDPVYTSGQEIDGFTEIDKFESKDKGGFVVLDMKDAYRNNVEYAWRGMKVDNDRTQMLLKDEIKLAYNADLYWFMHTQADVEVSDDGKTVILSKDGKQVYMLLESNCDAKFYLSDAKPLDGSPNPKQSGNEEFRKLNIELKNASGEIEIAVRFVPIYSDFMLSDIENYRKDMLDPMSGWEIEDGKIEKAYLSGISVNGEQIEDFDENTNTYTVVLSEETVAIPKVEASAAEEYEVNIMQPKSKVDSASIKVTNKDNPDIKNEYKVIFTLKPGIGKFGKLGENLPVEHIEVSAEPEPHNNRNNAIDNDLETRWASNGRQWLQIDLGKEKEFDTANVAFYFGDVRINYFEIAVSNDGNSWKTIYSGEGSGKTKDYEHYMIGNQSARYVRIIGNGSNIGNWNSISEFGVAKQN